MPTTGAGLIVWRLGASRTRAVSSQGGRHQGNGGGAQAAGFEVSVEIDDSVSKSVEEREADRDSDAKARAEVLHDRAEHHEPPLKRQGMPVDESLTVYRLGSRYSSAIIRSASIVGTPSAFRF